jgi:hypothetical protein
MMHALSTITAPVRRGVPHRHGVTVRVLAYNLPLHSHAGDQPGGCRPGSWVSWCRAATEMED